MKIQDSTRLKLEEQYHKQSMTYKELAEFYEVGIGVIRRLFKEYNIKPRKAGQIKGKPISQESRDKISKALKGKTKSKQHCKKLSEAMSGENHPNWGKKRKHPGRYWYQCPDGEYVSMRSGWEVSYAEWLNDNKIKWKYEPKTFLLEDGDAYTPDFYLIETNTYIEVKGWLREKHKKKIEGFKKKHPNEKWIFANKEYLEKIGCDLNRRPEIDRPKFRCILCSKEFYKWYDKSQFLCSVKCRNKYVAINRWNKI